MTARYSTDSWKANRKSSEERLSYSKEGVDLTLIRWMLSLTPSERLHVLQNQINSIQRIRSESGRN